MIVGPLKNDNAITTLNVTKIQIILIYWKASLLTIYQNIIKY